jgi:hypothetical protein
VLVAYQRFLEDRFGPALADAAFVGQERPSRHKSYPDEAFAMLVDVSAGLAKRPRDSLLREFGAHLIGTLHQLFPGFFPSEGARRFLVQLEGMVHHRIREAMPGAAPPHLTIEDMGGGCLRIQYCSDRSLCPLVAGMLDGTGAHYQTPVRYVEETCMRNGDPACTFLVEVQQTLLPRGMPRRRLPSD